MIDREIGRNCTGCAACVNSCPLDAVSLKEDNEGFWYPSVNYDACVHCKKCVTHCPSLCPTQPAEFASPDVYAGWNTDETIRLQSTSGGVFTALAQAVLEQGGYVVGARYNDDFSIAHTMISSVEELPLLRQSKYAQSDIGNVYRKIKDKLQQQQTVLFCGTPCQAAGLKLYLTKDYDKLYCCDFICRGIISPKVYSKFLNDMKQDTDKALFAVHFKNKDFGWNRFSTKLTFEDGTTYHKDRDHDYYMRGYLRYNLYLRPSCHQCQYKSLPRVADISLGDFWGIAKYDATLDNEKGTSVILVNSQKGRELLAQAERFLYTDQRSLEEVVAGNSCLFQAAKEGEYREYFFRNMDRYDFATLIERVAKKANKISVTERMRRAVESVKQRLR